MAAINLPPDFRDFLKLLNAHQVEYLLIGDYAVAYQLTQQNAVRLPKSPTSGRNECWSCPVY